MLAGVGNMKKYLFGFYDNPLDDMENYKFKRVIEADNKSEANDKAYEIAEETNTYYSLIEL